MASRAGYPLAKERLAREIADLNSLDRVSAFSVVPLWLKGNVTVITLGCSLQIRYSMHHLVNIGIHV